MKRIILIIYLLSSLTIKSQSIISIFTQGNCANKQVAKDIGKEIRKGKKHNTIAADTNIVSGDTLIYKINNNVDGFTLKFTFNIKYYDELYCDYQEYIFDCTPCSQKHLKEFIDGYKFLKKTENTYISSYSDKTEMTVKYKSDSKDCLILIFRHLTLSKKEYTELYNSLKKKTTA